MGARLFVLGLLWCLCASPNTHKTSEMPSYKASYSLICHKIMIHTTWCAWIPKTVGVLKIELFFPLESLWRALWWHNKVYKIFKLAPRNNNTISLSGQIYLLQRCSWKTSPQIPPLTLHPPCSHRGNMPCLSKLTTSSLQQSQQTCMGTYLSKIEDSSYPWTMAKVFGSTHV